MKYIKLQDVTEFIRNGASIKQPKQCFSGIPITRIETIANDQFNWDSLGYADINDNKYEKYYLKDNDVLLSHINSEKFVGHTVLFKKKDDSPIIHGMNLLCIRFLQDKYIPDLFNWYTKSQTAKIYYKKNLKRAVNQASITATAIKNMPIPDLSYDQQKEIVDYFNSIQKAKDILNTQFENLNELVEIKLDELFC